VNKYFFEQRNIQKLIFPKFLLHPPWLLQTAAEFTHFTITLKKSHKNRKTVKTKNPRKK